VKVKGRREGVEDVVEEVGGDDTTECKVRLLAPTWYGS
jgi:hypothetical protein